LVQCFRFQASSELTMAGMAIGADDLAFPNWMVGWQRSLAENLGVTPVTRPRFVDAHRAAFVSANFGVAYTHQPLDVRTGMGVVAVGTSDTFSRME
jgi:hypothetical protein